MGKRFSTVTWANGANIYEVNIRQYTPEGTFNAFAHHLPRLRDMGVDILWLMPITPISIKGRLGSLGSYYACSSYTKINPEFGTLDDIKSLILKAHALGFKLIIDWVANHTGWDHEWTIEHPEWFVKDQQGNFTDPNGWADVIDLDYTNYKMRNALIDAMRYWINECNIDGFRCDMAHLVPLEFWSAARQACETIKPLFWLAECDVADYHQVFDVSYAWNWMHISEKLMKGHVAVHDVWNVLHEYSKYPTVAQKLFFTSNHDENSWNGTEYEKYGNAAKAMAVFTNTWSGMPLIYSGQELPNYKRLEFFNKDVIEWKDQIALHEFYKTLFALHKTKAIAEGAIFILPSEKEGVMAFLRKYEAEVVLVLLNLSSHDKVQLNVYHEWLKGSFTNVFSGLTFSFNYSMFFELQAGEYIIYKTVN